MSRSVSKWIIERDKTLETRDVNELIKFMEKWANKGLYGKEMVERFKNANEQVQLGSMCKMIMNCTNISETTKKWAKEQLDKMGWSSIIY